MDYESPEAMIVPLAPYRVYCLSLDGENSTENIDDDGYELI